MEQEKLRPERSQDACYRAKCIAGPLLRQLRELPQQGVGGEEERGGRWPCLVALPGGPVIPSCNSHDSLCWLPPLEKGGRGMAALYIAGCRPPNEEGSSIPVPLPAGLLTPGLFASSASGTVFRLSAIQLSLPFTFHTLPFLTPISRKPLLTMPICTDLKTSSGWTAP